MTNRFVSLHTHGMASSLDGFSKPEEMAKRTAELDQPAIAITDHGTMSCALKFYKACKAEGVKPIIGMESYLTQEITSRDKDSTTYHLGLLAKNNRGVENLFELSDVAWNKGYYRKPRLDLSTISSIACLEGKTKVDDIICLTGCMDGPVAYHLRRNEYGEARQFLHLLKDVFENIFVELQPWNPKELNLSLAELADLEQIPMVATLDAHYAFPDDRVAAEANLIISQIQGQKKSEKDYLASVFSSSRQVDDLMERINLLHPNRKIRFDRYEMFLMDRGSLEQKMKAMGIDREDIYEHTVEIAEEVDIELNTNQDVFPTYAKNIDSTEYLKDLAYDGLKDLKLDNDEYISRLDEELGIVKKLKFEDYFLIIWDMIHTAKSRDVYVGPGRGSVGGSLLAYALGITKIDPIKYKLLFWRFLHGGRIEPPDIDIDFEDFRRDEIKEYMIERWKNAASISTYTEFTSRGLVRDLARVFAIPLGEVNKVCKQFDDIQELQDSKDTAWFRTRYPEIVELAKRFEGRWRQGSRHAAGMVIANKPLYKILPIESRTYKDVRVPVVAYDMNDTQEVGLIKMDLLGIEALSVVHNCINALREKGIDVDVNALEPDDPVIIKEFNDCRTQGIFQFEKASSTNLLRKMGVDSFHDLVVANGLVRPGPLITVGQEYINRKKGYYSAEGHPVIEEITSDTFGLFVFQEQLLEALVKIGGFTWTEADKVRKIIGKKKDSSEFKEWEDKWVDNASPLLGEKKAKKLWEDFTHFAGYAFNKSHSVAYSLLAYQQMWLKKYYPTEYIYSLLRTETDDDKKTTYLLEAKRLGIKIELPDINLSKQELSLDGGVIRFGFSNVKGIGKAASEELVTNQPYSSIEDLDRCDKRKVNTKIKKLLLEVGALSSMGHEGTDACFELLGLPNVDLDKIPDLGIEFTPLADFISDNIQIVRAFVKSVDRHPEFIRILLEDSSGISTLYYEDEIDTGRIIIAVVTKNSIGGYTYEDEFLEKLDKGYELNAIEKFLCGKSFDGLERVYNYGVGGIGDERSLVIPVHHRVYQTKKGNTMASFMATDGEEAIRIAVWPSVWSRSFNQLHRFRPVILKLNPLREEGEYEIVRDGVRDVDNYLNNKDYMQKVNTN